MKARNIVVGCLFAMALFGCGDDLKQQNDLLRERVTVSEKGRENAEAALKKVEGERNSLRESLARQVKQMAEVQADLARTRDENAKIKAEYAVLHKSNEERLNSMKKGEVRGVVNYFFNKNFGYKPDVGSVVTVVRADSHPDVTETLIKFRKAKVVLESKKVLQELVKLNKDRVYQERLEAVKKDAEKLGVASKGEWEALSDRAKKLVRNVEYDENKITTSVDASGVFRKALSPGEYIVLVRSSQRKSDNSLEFMGQVIVEKIKIAADSETSLDFKFEP